MEVTPDPAEGQTPLDEDEKEGLLIPTIATRGELDEFEQLGIQRAVEWSLRRRFEIGQILTEEFVQALHRRMFGEVWEWAGQFRRTNKNLGSDVNEIRPSLRLLLDDARYWAEHRGYPPDEIAVRFSHRIVSVRPFPNGNGRHSRLIADILVEHGYERPPFSWGRASLVSVGDARTAYLRALRAADDQDYGPLLRFARE
ncbi:MAG: mobile mystery protein B [Bacteroidetes bacterium]|jgi:Fic-DOC domain mobile mystery protein B|nr:mobile mystery protein B [Bacteroidota bacterium]